MASSVIEMAEDESDLGICIPQEKTPEKMQKIHNNAKAVINAIIWRRALPWIAQNSRLNK